MGEAAKASRSVRSCEDCLSAELKRAFCGKLAGTIQEVAALCRPLWINMSVVLGHQACRRLVEGPRCPGLDGARSMIAIYLKHWRCHAACSKLWPMIYNKRFMQRS